ncbi:MAG: F0F1 ATP synthase subunit A [Iamia sp.]
MILGLEFPPVSHAINWPGIFFEGTPFEVNKVVILMWLSVALVFGFYMAAGRKQELVPRGLQNAAESAVEFIREGIIVQTMGQSGMGYAPFLLGMFSFIFVCNIWEIIPGAQMPVNARIAVPILMTAIVWVMYIVVGIKNQGPIGYFKNSVFPPGVPKPLYVLVAPIELATLLFVRPLSLSVRLFANMLAGHLLLISFAVLSTALVAAKFWAVLAIATGGLLVGLVAFEILVSFLQAYIFTILTAVYIGDSQNPEH